MSKQYEGWSIEDMRRMADLGANSPKSSLDNFSFDVGLSEEAQRFTKYRAEPQQAPKAAPALKEEREPARPPVGMYDVSDGAEELHKLLAAVETISQESVRSGLYPHGQSPELDFADTPVK